MSYQSALEAAGVTVHDFKEFGSYQGEWVAYVTFEGETGFITGGYGSCSGCDAFESEFGWGDDKEENYQQRLADFGRGYLPVQTAEQAKQVFQPLYGVDDQEGIDWINDRANSEQAHSN